ncbi:hypothetical protein Sango_3018300 [Sesamum angolense]|uniref:U-box domain-containing protein n=1 Tax=Sesamum angolense TaxID=2727404 RepID=A0AAE1VSF5_9LAMI|nr:hypothetical protein Sango_3018300 [Sesamum angolense]
MPTSSLALQCQWDTNTSTPPGGASVLALSDAMKTNQPKLKTTPRTQLFSCGFFRQCTQTVLSPTTSTPPPLPEAAPPPPPPPVQPTPPAQPESSSSSSSNTSQSFTQWRFPLSNSPISHHSYSQPKAEAVSEPDPKLEAVPPLLTNASLEELFHVAELQFSSGSDAGRLGAVHLLERSLVPNPRSAGESTWRWGGAVTAVVEALTDAESAVAERLLAALELLCTTAEGAAEVRAHALAVPMMVQVMGRMEGRGKEHAISVLAVIYGGLEEGVGVAPAEEVARAVMLALQGDCSARGRRKGAQLLKILQEKGGVEEER